MVLLSDKHPIDLTIGQELPPTFHYAWVILPHRDGTRSDRVDIGTGTAASNREVFGSLLEPRTRGNTVAKKLHNKSSNQDDPDRRRALSS